MDVTPFHLHMLELIQAHAWEQAKNGLEARLADHPHEAMTLRLLARLEIRKGDFGKARELLEHAVRYHGGMDEKIEKALLVPPIPGSTAMIDDLRGRMLSEIKTLEQSGEQLRGPVEMLHIPSFYLAYQGRDDRKLQESIAGLLLKAAPSLAFTAPHGTKDRPRPEGNIRIGLCSNNLRNNSVGLFFLGFAQALRGKGFELHLFRAPSGGSDQVTLRYIQSADHDTQLSSSLETAQRQIAEKNLDILFYPDLTVHPLTNWLAFARLAPVQMTSWGHPVTSGLPHVDYYISSRLMECENAREHYSEHLVELSTFPCCYQPPQLLSSPAKRHHFRLPEKGAIYCCGHQAFKFHPDFDTLLGQILRKDPTGTLVLINGWGGPNHGRLLENRIKSANPDVADRILMLGRMPPIQYLAMTRLADVHLDPVWFGGGRTSFDLLSNGNIVVTWPGPFQRGRVTGACLSRMGVDECIAETWEDYVDMAVEFANDETLRFQTREKIIRNAHLIFDHPAFIEEMTAFMRQAVART